MENLIAGFGIAVYVFAFLWYAVKVWRGGATDVNSASLLMWVVIDVIYFFATLKAEQPLWLPSGYVIGTLGSFIAVHAKGVWVWSSREWRAAGGAAFATIVWQTADSDLGVAACMVALLIAGIPMFLDQVKQPVRSTWPMWAATAFACFCTLIASDWTFAGTVVAWGGITFNVPLLLIVLRKK